METKEVSRKSLETIDKYIDFTIANAKCSIPYFNNRYKGKRGSLAVNVGKGSPEEIHNEVEEILLKQKIDKNSLTPDDLKKILVENNIGIDCSGFVYHVLDLKKANLYNPNGLLSKIRSLVSPAKNIDVKTLVHDSNSKTIDLRDIKPSDIITSLGERDHILLVYKVEYENSIPKKIYYVHSMSWPSDGQYEHGIKRGFIEIIDINTSILDQKWSEEYTHTKSKESKTELRRLHFLC